MKTTMTMLIIFMAIISKDALAMRCSGQIIQPGDSVSKVLQLCNIKDDYQVNNKMADVRYIYDTKGGRDHRITVIDGRVTDIQE